MFTALLGAATFKWKNPCVAIPFGCITFTVGLLLLILGSIVDGLGGGISIEGFRERGCNSFPKVKEMYLEAVDKTMCSELCPCDEGES